MSEDKPRKRRASRRQAQPIYPTRDAERRWLMGLTEKEWGQKMFTPFQQLQAEIRQESIDNFVVGKNPALAALRNPRREIEAVYISAPMTISAEVWHAALQRHIPPNRVMNQELDEIAMGVKHHGILLITKPLPYAEIEDALQLAEARQEAPLLLALDKIEDPRNLGAILRTAEAAGAHGVIVPEHGSAPLSRVVSTTSMGAVERVPVIRAKNMVRMLKDLKTKGFWVAGADLEGQSLYAKTDLTGSLVVVLGNEGKGIRRLVRGTCDFLVHIPMQGEAESLNVSVAAALFLYEARRQRSVS